MIQWKPIVALLIATAIGVTTASAQTCESVSAALEALAGNCTTLSRGNLCQDGQATSFTGLNDFKVDTLALAQIQANYPDVAPKQFVSMAFVGALDVQPVVETSAEALPNRVPVYVVVTGTQANVRAQPVRTNAPAIAKLDDGTTLNATGVSKSGAWVRIQLPDQPNEAAWINKSLLQSDYDMTALPVISANDPIPQYPEFTPMQAFSFTAGSPCAGVLLQSGDALARLQVNGVELELNGATTFLQNTGTALVINVLDGEVQVQVQSVTTISLKGASVSVPLDASGAPDVTPEATSEATSEATLEATSEAPSIVPTPYDQAALERLNGKYMPLPVAAVPAASAQAIQDALVTPLSGRWKINFPPPYDYTSLEGGSCGELKVKEHSPIFEITVSDDGSSLSTFNKTITLGAGVRALPGLYELQDFKFKVLSPTEMTATYDTNPAAACTSIITITADWLGPSQ